jgi:hypothetical protein
MAAVLNAASQLPGADSYTQGEENSMSIGGTMIVLARGWHPAPAGVPVEGCFFEWYNWITCRKYTDSRPPGVSEVLHWFGAQLNDILPDSPRQYLIRFLPDDGTDRLAGTAEDGKDETRGFMCLDWLIRTDMPAWLGLAGLDAEAAALRGLPRISDVASAESAAPVVHAAAARSAAARREAAWDEVRHVTSWDAVWPVYRATTREAARDAAEHAVMHAGCSPAHAQAAVGLAAIRDAARDATVVAAWTAARGSAGDAARDAVGKKLAPVTAALQHAAIRLFDRLIAGTACVTSG